MAATLENIMEDFKEEPEHNEEHLQADPFYDITEDFEESEHTEEDGLLNDNVGVKPSEKRLKIACNEPGCMERFSSVKIFRDHLEKKHLFEMTCEKLSFVSQAEYEKWKENYEQENCCLFVRRTGSRSNPVKNTCSSYMYCSRSGYRETKKDGRPKKSMKAGVICTASIIYKQLGHGEISVTLYPRHYGHDLDVAQLRLSKEDKHVILAEVSEGKSPSDIADKLSLSAGLRDANSTMSRLCLVNKRDVEFVMEKERMANKVTGIPETCIKNDFTSLDTWCAELSADNGTISPVIYYKPLGYKTATLSTYDVCLILMTDHMRKMLNQCGDTLVYLTSMTIPKIKYYVTFLFVLDEFYTPFPVFLMVSNKINNPQLNVMLESLRADMKAHKINLESKIFMTDRNPSAFTMWKDLIYAKSKHMVCPRYIDNEWRKYLATIFHEDTQDEIYDQLCELLEPKDHDAHALLSKVLAKLESNTMCSKFLTYFNKFYTTCFDEWGGHMLKEIINIHSVPNFEKILTEIQETLDAKYKKYSRNVVKILQMLFKRIISYQYARTTALAAIRTATEHNHRTALSTDLKKVYRTENEDEWRVVLDSKEIVKKNKYLPKCCRSDDVECSILCEQCAICVHEYVCTCHVYTVQNIVCVHIHLVARMMTHTLLSDVLEKNKAVLNQFDPPTIPSEVATPSEPEPSTQVEGEVALRKAIIQSLNNTQDKLYLIQDENKLRALFNIAEELHSLTCEMYNKDKTSTKTKIKAFKPHVIKKSAKSVITNDKGVVKNKNKPEQKQFVNIDVINVEPGMVPQIKTNETTNEKVIYVPSQNIQIVLDENRNPDENISENTNRRNSKNLNEIANVDEKQTTPCPETLVVAPAPRFNAPEKVIETQNTKKKPLNKTNTSHDVPDHIGKLDDVPTFHIHKKNKTETKDFAQSNKPEQVKRNKSETVEPNKQEVVKPSKPKVAETIKPNELNKSDTNTCENSSGSCPTISTTDNIASKLIVQTSGTNNVSATTIASWDIELSWQNKKILIPLHKDPKAGIEKIIQKVNAGHFVYKNEKDKRGDIISTNKPSIINQLSVILKLLHNPDDKVVAKPEGPVTVKLLEHREPLTLKRKIEEFSQQNYLKKENEGLVMSKTNENIPKKTEPLPMKGKIAENVSENICQTRPNAKEIVQCRQTQIPNRSQRAVEPSSKETGSYGENTKETSEPEIETLLPSKKGTKYVSETKALSPVEKTNTFQSAEVLPPPEKITKVESESPSEQVVIHTSDEALPPPDKVIKLECSEYNAADLGDRVSSSPDQQTEVERTIPKRVVRTLRPEIQNKFNSPHNKGCLKVLKPCIR